jgi:hypothetical protein
LGAKAASLKVMHFGCPNLLLCLSNVLKYLFIYFYIMLFKSNECISHFS